MIGSVHFLKKGDKYVAFDRREVSLVQEVIDIYILTKNGFKPVKI